MGDVMVGANVIAAMGDDAIARVSEFQSFALKLPQEPIATQHLFHAGMYARSIVIPAGIVLTGALIRIATVLIISGDVVMYIDGEARELHGYHVFAASAQRKQAFVALTDTSMTMLFPTQARTVADAEAEFTAEADLLFSRNNDNTITVTGE